MGLKVICTTSRSCALELENNFSYYNDQMVSVYLDNSFVFETNKNVISLFDLKPSTKYQIKVGNDEITVQTKEETVCLNVLDFIPLNQEDHFVTNAFQAAIMSCPKNGCVYVPKGTYYVQPLFLKSDMTLYLEKGAVIKGDIERTNYAVLPGLVSNKKTGYEINLGTWEGDEVASFASLISGLYVENVTICGEGEINGNATNGDWYQNHRVKRIAYRPFNLFFNRSNNIICHGITSCNSPSWNVHPYFSKNLSFIDMKITNIPSMPTTDGLDPDTCFNVNIIGNYFSVGDDCIAIKSGQIDFAKKYHTPCKQIIIRNCLMEHGHGGVVFGSESSGGIEDVYVSKCIFNKTDRGLRIKTRRGRGRYGIIDNVNFENIIMDDVLTPFVVNMYYNMGPAGGHEEYVWTKEKLPVDERTPYIGKFHFKNMKCLNTSYSAGVFLGLPEEPIKGITLENIEFTYKKDAIKGSPVMIEHSYEVLKQGLDFHYVDDVIIDNVSIKGAMTDEVLLDNVGKFIRK